MLSYKLVFFRNLNILYISTKHNIIKYYMEKKLCDGIKVWHKLNLKKKMFLLFDVVSKINLVMLIVDYNYVFKIS